ncbi:MAG TPA: hypothetical protein VMG30_18945 [Acidobacteriota bacterium]|nr:hypothetical protein [Acidobacteriota bacterium]
MFANTNVSPLEMVKLQAQVLLPVLEAFQTERGEERATRIARTALQQLPHKLSQDIEAQSFDDPWQKWEAIYAVLIGRFSSDAKAEVPGQGSDAPVFNANESGSADIFRELGEQELRWALVCDVNSDVAAVGNSEVTVVSDANENEWCEVW